MDLPARSTEGSIHGATLTDEERSACAALDFTVIQVQEVFGGEFQVVQLVHQPSGARVYCTQRPTDIQNRYDIIFRTQTRDATGVWHSLEHAVIGGLGPHPYFELKIGLILQSINAQTRGDSLQFCAAGNDLPSLRLAFRTTLELIFSGPPSREGFNREHGSFVVGADGSVGFTGIVHSEMTRKLNDPVAWRLRGLRQALAPETSARFPPGGDPRAMAELGYEEFVAAYHGAISPRQAEICFAGPAPLSEKVALIAHGLRGFSGGQEVLPLEVPVWRAGFTSEVCHFPFRSMANDAVERAYCGRVWWRLPQNVDPQGRFEIALLLNLLGGEHDGSLALAARRTSNLAVDLDVEFHDVLRARYIVITSTDCSRETAAALSSFIRSYLAEAVTKGFDRTEIERHVRAIAEAERLDLARGDYAAALNRQIRNAVVASEHGLDLLSLAQRGALLLAKIEAGERVLEQWIARVCLDQNASGGELLCAPDETFCEQLEKEEYRRVQNAFARLSPQERLRRVVMEVPSQDFGECFHVHHFPLVPLSIDRLARSAPFVETRVGSVPHLIIEEALPRLGKITLYFDLSDFSPEEVWWANFSKLLLEHWVKVGCKETPLLERLADCHWSLMTTIHAVPSDTIPSGTRLYWSVAFLGDPTALDRVTPLVQNLMREVPDVSDDFLQRFIIDLAIENSRNRFREPMVYQETAARLIELINPARSAERGLSRDVSLGFVEQLRSPDVATLAGVRARLLAIGNRMRDPQRARVVTETPPGDRDAFTAAVESIVSARSGFELLADEEALTLVSPLTAATAPLYHRVGIAAAVSSCSTAAAIVLDRESMEQRGGTRCKPPACFYIAAFLLERLVMAEARQRGRAYGVSAIYDAEEHSFRFATSRDPTPERIFDCLTKVTPFLRSVNEDLLARAKVRALAGRMGNNTAEDRAQRTATAWIHGQLDRPAEAVFAAVQAVTLADVAAVAATIDAAIKAGRVAAVCLGPSGILSRLHHHRYLDVIESSSPPQGKGS